MDWIRLVAMSTASSNIIRWIIWLKQWSGDAGSKTLTELPPFWKSSIGEALDSLVKRVTGGKSTLLPPGKSKSKQNFRHGRSFRPYGKGSQFSTKKQSDGGFSMKNMQAKSRGSWQNKGKSSSKPSEA